MAYRRTPEVMKRLAARHRDILAAAAKMLAKRGNVDMDAVAEAAGVAVGTLYKDTYFPSREALVEAAVQHMVETHLAAMRSAADAANNPVNKLVISLKTFIGLQTAAPCLLDQPFYCNAMALEFTALMRAAAPRTPTHHANLAGCATVGAIRGVLMHGLHRDDIDILARFALAIAVPAMASRVSA